MRPVCLFVLLWSCCLLITNIKLLFQFDFPTHTEKVETISYGEYFKPRNFLIYRMSGDFVSTFIPVFYPSQKCHMKTSPVPNSYETLDICNSKWRVCYVERQGHPRVWQHRRFCCAVPLICLHCNYTPHFSRNPIHRNLEEVRSSDRSGQLCWSPRPIHPSGMWLFRHCVACRLKCRVHVTLEENL
jgi:hypothetical protein